MAKRSKIVVSVAEKLRLTLQECSALVNLSDTYLRAMERRGDFPPRLHVGTELGGKWQFVAAEVRAWAEGRDWRAMVAARTEVSHAS